MTAKGEKDMTADTVMRTMLFDFYGELLTKKQREYFDLHYNEDLSLQEIAEQSGVSRQAVWDIIRRAEALMQKFEGKIGLVSRLGGQKQKLKELSVLISEISEKTDGETKKLCEKASEVIKTLED